MLSVNWQDIKPLLTLGVLAELWLQFPGFEAVGLIVLARVLLGICDLGAACLHQPEPGAMAPQSERNVAGDASGSALPASALPAPITSKGHRTEKIPELLLVTADKVEGYKKTKEAVLLFKKHKAWNDMILSEGEPARAKGETVIVSSAGTLHHL